MIVLGLIITNTQFFYDCKFMSSYFENITLRLIIDITNKENKIYDINTFIKKI